MDDSAKAGKYVNARIRSRLLNVAAIGIISGYVLFWARTIIDNFDNTRFFSELMDPISLFLLAFPIVVALILMFFSRRADKEMERILREHEAEMQQRKGKKGARSKS